MHWQTRIDQSRVVRPYWDRTFGVDQYVLYSGARIRKGSSLIQSFFFPHSSIFRDPVTSLHSQAHPKVFWKAIPHSVLTREIAPKERPGV
jgi:hypothetical protein